MHVTQLPPTHRPPPRPTPTLECMEKCQRLLCNGNKSLLSVEKYYKKSSMKNLSVKASPGYVWFPPLRAFSSPSLSHTNTCRLQSIGHTNATHSPPEPSKNSPCASPTLEMTLSSASSSSQVPATLPSAVAETKAYEAREGMWGQTVYPD